MSRVSGSHRIRTHRSQKLASPFHSLRSSEAAAKSSAALAHCLFWPSTTKSSNLLGELTCLRIRLGAFLTREVKHVLLQGATSLQQVCLPNCKGLSIDPEVILNKDQRCKMADNTDSFQYKLPPCKCHFNPCSLVANKIMHDNAVNCAVEP